ncbi:site-specific integrase [Aerococcus sp. UMB8608]|uniref:Tyr recombinase domain-containing protein n=1 Tax=Aerococcus sanguinicola TaxID=119206 RepID=A0A109RD18_9LACT|nr:MULTISPECIES: site-specific integrase [Aerococcus]AMB93291.1 hypothetical protein AWM72_00145 [Aerococcus sanguinicola]MDK6679390.1 site-specific integrase [Aerococcus sp. UMB8608]MDK6685768.1 site-specific integrase [Aerococcus sp. UMB8623]OFT95923.1 hypothetical protein HMPREF3090_03625 [Aerococcus sp. HMSC23C02]
MNIYKYTLKNGQEKYGIKEYLGLDELTGKQVNYFKKGFDSEEEAKLAYQRANVQFEDGQYKVKTGSYTFEEVYHMWLDYYKMTVQSSTLKRTKQIFRDHLLPILGKQKINKIHHVTLQKLVNNLSQKVDSYQKIFGYAKRIFTWAFKKGIIHENTAEKVDVPTKLASFDDEDSYVFYTKTELQQVLNTLEKYAPKKWYAFFRTLAYTGMRRGEIMALKWEDINFNQRTINIYKSIAVGDGNKRYIAPPKTKHGKRKIAIDDITLHALKRWRTEQAQILLENGLALNDQWFIFSKQDENEPISLSKPWTFYDKFCKRHGLRFIKIHGFRHTHCTLLFDAGVPLQDVRDRLGHSSIKITVDIYNHVTDQQRDKTLNSFVEFMDQPSNL